MTATLYLAILVSSVVYMILGALWYSPALFGKTWMKGIGKTDSQVKADFKPINYLWAFLGSLLAAYGISRILLMIDHGRLLGTGAIGMREGLMVGAVAGVCFAAAPFFVNDAMEGRPRSLTIANALYHLVSFLIMGSILGAWR